MSGNNPKVSHLSVVKSETQSPTVQIVTIDNLSSADRARAERYVTQSKMGGILVGALMREFPWNLKPLVLDQGMLRIVRFTDPTLPLDSWRCRSFEMLSKQYERWSKSVAGAEFGESEGQYWYKRNFAQRTLSEISSPQESELGTHPVALAQKVIRLVGRWEEEGLIHGHLCRSNIVVDHGEALVIDPLICSFSHELVKVTVDAAPELLRGDSPSHATDLFGLGRILQFLLGDLLNEHQKEIVAALVSTNPLGRPLIKIVQENFGTERFTKEQAPPTPSGGTGEFRMGKVIVENTSIESLYGESQRVTRSPDEALEWLTGTAVLGSDIVARIRDAIGNEASEPVQPSTLLDPPSPKVAAPKVGLPKQQSRWLRGFAALLLVVAIGIAFKEPLRRLLFEPTIPEGAYELFWTSGNQLRMRAVARAAASYRNKDAEHAIITDALAGNERPRVRTSLLRTVFDPRWANELKPVDREVGFKIALAELLPEIATDVPSLTQVHPAVLLAIISSLKPSDDGAGVAGIPISKMFGLPTPIGDSYRKLELTGVKDFGQSAPRALAALLTGKMTPEYLDAYFSKDDEAVQAVGKLRILRDARNSTADLALIYETLLASNGLLHDYISWFEAPQPGLWKSIGLGEKLGIASGDLPTAPLSMERLADLLTFPLSVIRQTASELLSREFFPPHIKPLIDIIGGPDNKLTRVQSVTLLAAFDLEGEPRFSFISKWFKTNPDVGTVLKLLIARREGGAVDPFGLEGARYLKSKSWDPTKEQLNQLLIHPEPMVRALGYIRLDPARPEDQKTLHNLLRVETNQRLREEIGRKLGVVQ